MKLIKKNNKKGFTLIELVIVIAILAILALILVPTIGGYTDKANKSKAETSVRSIYTEAVLLSAEKDANLTTIGTDLSTKYGATVLVTDPSTGFTVSYDDGKYLATYNGKAINSTKK